MPLPGPTWAEIQRWRERLEDRDFQRAHLAFQSYVYTLFEDLRKQTGLKLIRTVMSRDEIKTVDSLVQKIHHKRAGQQSTAKPYDFTDLQDFIGVKVLCPYDDNADQVVNWLYDTQNHLVMILQGKPKRREDEWGYRGYNFTVCPAKGFRPALGTVYCEVQVKTLTEEAWDAMTHDITYKRGGVPKEYKDVFTDLSNLLNSAQNMARKFRTFIEDLYKAEVEQRALACQTLFSYSLDYFTFLDEVRKKRIEAAEKCEWLLPEISETKAYTGNELHEINTALREIWVSQGNNAELCKAAAWIALISKDPGQEAFASSLIEDLNLRNPNNPKFEDTRALMYWAFSRFNRVLESCDLILAQCNSGVGNWPRSDVDQWKADCCYFISDAQFFSIYVPAEFLKKVPDLIEDILRGPLKDEPFVLDTVGFTKIVRAQTPTEVKEGIKFLVKAAKKMKKISDEKHRRLALTFHDYHRQIGERRLKELQKSTR